MDDPTSSGAAAADRTGVWTVIVAAGGGTRFGGAKQYASLGGRRVLVLGGLVTTAGLVLVLQAAHAFIAIAGFLVVGLGASNIVPVLFTQAGRQTSMPNGLAIAAMTAIGYAGILAGPAAMGFVADVWSLPAAFGMLAAAMLLVTIFAKPATREDE